MYKTEKVLSLVSAIIGIVMFVIMLLVGGLFGAADLFFGGGGGIAVWNILAIVLALVSFILGFIASSKLGKDNKSGGVMALVAGGLALISCIAGFILAFGFLQIPSIALYLTAGIMALAKKTAAAAPPPAA